jgi:tetratricopeptide (TPR) repeat protein
LYEEGNAHYSAGRYTLAAELFIKAYELSGKPALLFNLANTYERAGNYEKAAKYLRMYLDGGEVHDVASVRARLQRLELAATEQKKDAADAKPVAPSTPPPNQPLDKPARVAKGKPSTVPYYIAGAGFFAGATAAVVFGLRAGSERSEIDKLCTPQGDGVICPPQAEPHLSNERSYALISDVGIGIAAASVATGVIYYLVTRDTGSADEPSQQALSIVPTGGGLSVFAGGRF